MFPWAPKCLLNYNDHYILKRQKFWGAPSMARGGSRCLNPLQKKKNCDLILTTYAKIL